MGSWSEDEERDRAFARGANDHRARLRAVGRPAVRAFIEQQLGVFYGEGSSACSPCPFAEAELDDPPNYHDPDEGYYTCHLVGRSRVWGESPVCTDAAWRDRARDELAQLERAAGEVLGTP